MLKKPFNVICSTLVLLVVISVLLAINSPASGYEVSIYTSTPIAMWILIITSITTCIILLVREALKEDTCRRWLFPLGILVANGVIVLLLSVFRDYYAVGSDTLVHIGYVKDLSNGILSETNNYPAIHVIPTLLVRMGLSPEISVNIMPALCYLVYVISFYWLAKYIWGNKKEVIIATTLSAALLLSCGAGMKATFVAVSIVPITVLLVLKLQDKFTIRRSVVLLVIVAIIAMIHPLALEVATIALVIACVVIPQNRFKFIIFTVVALLMVFVLYFYLYEAVDSLATVEETAPISNIASESAPPFIEEVVNGGGSSFAEIIESSQTIGSYSALSLVVRKYGSEMLIGILAIISLLMMIKKRGNRYFMYFGVMFIILNAMWIVGWFSQAWQEQLPIYNPYYSIICAVILVRMLFWIPFVSIIVVVPLLVKLVRLRIMPIVLVIVIAVISVSTLFNVYPSPITGTANSQITHQHVNGIKWLLESGDSENKILHLNTYRPGRFVFALYGVQWCWDNRIAYWFHGYEPLREFSYTDSSTIGYEYPCDIYLIVTKMDKTLLRWETDHLYLLESDPAVTLVYRNGDELDIWLVKSQVKEN